MTGLNTKVTGPWEKLMGMGSSNTMKVTSMKASGCIIKLREMEHTSISMEL